MEIILQFRSNGRWPSCECRDFFKPPPSPCMNSTQCLAPCFTSTQDHPFLSSSISSTSVDQTASEAPSPPVSRRKRSVSFSSSSSSSSPSRCVIQAVCRRCRRLYGFGALNTFAMIKTILGWFYILCDNGFASFWEPNIIFNSFPSFKSAENVRAFAGSRPPIVLFLIFLSSLAATLFFMTYYLRDNEIRDPSVENDWNLFLKNLANVDFCVLSRRWGCLFMCASLCVICLCYCLIAITRLLNVPLK